MNVFVTGGTGFAGTYIVNQLLDDGYSVTCLVRSNESASSLPDTVTPFFGDVLDDKSLEGAFDGMTGVIHLVGIIEEKKSKGVTFENLHVEATRNIVEGAKTAGVSTFIHMSANGARQDGVSRYQTTKWEAEQIVKGANFDWWTIFRPSFLFGDPGPDNPEFVKRMATSLIKPFPILPVFGTGRYRLQPVSIENVATAFSSALTNQLARNRSYVAVGRESHIYDDILDIITRACGYDEKAKIHQPVLLARPLVHTLGRIGLLPISPDQFEMLLEGNTGNPVAFFNDFGIEEIPFIEDNLTYVRQYI